MARVSVSWGNSLKNFKNLVNGTTRRVNKGIEQSVDKTGIDVRRIAKRRTPIKTRRLIRGWILTKNKKGAKRENLLVNEVDYAFLIENGTSDRPPARMLGVAVIEGNKIIQKRVARVLRKAGLKFNSGV